MLIPTAEDWQAFAGVVVVIVFLGGAYAAIKRILSSKGATTQAPVKSDLDKRVETVEKAVTDLRLCLAENYVRRDDYVVGESRVIGLLEDNARILIKLEERVRQQ